MAESGTVFLDEDVSGNPVERGTEMPTLESRRLVLRPFQISDAVNVRRLAGDWSIADTTLNVPHPYEDGMAEQWIATHQPSFLEGTLITFAVTLRDGDELVGALALKINRMYDIASLGYWIAKSHWNLGYCTEAANAAVAYGFRELRLNRIHANYLARNPASGRVLEKIGMSREGVARQHAKKWDKYEDLIFYGLLREEWRPTQECLDS